MAAKKIRYAVIGLGWIAQESILPAFKHAENSQLAALVSDDKEKLRALGDKYRVPNLYLYKEFDACLNSKKIDAIFIALPNSMHLEYTVRAAQAGIHILCEKPLAMTEKECAQMISAANKNKVKLMTAYRLHFEEGNLHVIELARRGKLGDVRAFNSTNTMSVETGNIRLDKGLSGGTLYDIGIYCINAARGIFREEPVEVFAVASRNGQKRFKEVEEMMNVIMTFSKDRTASFVCSFGAADSSAYDVIGTKARVRMEDAYRHAGGVRLWTFADKTMKSKTFAARDQFAAEIIYFSKCILTNKQPEPSGLEGQADVRIIEAMYESAKQGRTVKLKSFHKNQRPTMKQEIRRPQGRKPRLVNAEAPKK